MSGQWQRIPGEYSANQHREELRQLKRQRKLTPGEIAKRVFSVFLYTLFAVVAAFLVAVGVGMIWAGQSVTHGVILIVVGVVGGIVNINLRAAIDYMDGTW